jgi:hypothetical protein
LRQHLNFCTSEARKIGGRAAAAAAEKNSICVSVFNFVPVKQVKQVNGNSPLLPLLYTDLATPFAREFVVLYQ